jgi:hypothetical protein
MGDNMIEGIRRSGGKVGVTWITDAIIQTALANAKTAIATYGEKRAEKMKLVAAQSVADEQGSRFISAARGVMVLFLGSTYSDAWAPTGFPNQSTAVPESMAERQTLLNSL